MLFCEQKRPEKNWDVIVVTKNSKDAIECSENQVKAGRTS